MWIVLVAQFAAGAIGMGGIASASGIFISSLVPVNHTFASQVWYSYWIMGAGYGAAKKDVYGKPANVSWLKSISVPQALKLKKWTHVVYSDAIVAMIIGTTVTLGFLIAGAGTLGVKHLAPEGEAVAIDLSNLFSIRWGQFGATLFLLGGTAALVSTLIGQLAGWPRLVADSFRICIPKVFGKYSWKIQFRFFLIVFLITNIFIVNILGYKPVALVKLSALMDGLMLTPLQALWVAIGLYFVMPRIFTGDIYKVLKPHWIVPVILGVAVIVFSYFFIFQIPYVF